MSVFLLRGKDEALLGEAITELVHRLVGDGDRSLVVDEFDGDDYAISAVVDAAQTPPFLTERRVVVARDLERFNADEARALIGYLADPLDTTDLVLASAGAPPKPLLDAVKKAGATIGATGAADRQGAQPVDRRAAGAQRRRRSTRPPRPFADWLGEDVGRLAAVLERWSRPSAPAAASAPPTWSRSSARPAGCRRGTSPTPSTGATRPRRWPCWRRMLGAGDRHPLVVMATLQSHYERMLRLDGAPVTTAGAASLLKVARRSRPRRPSTRAAGSGHEGIARAFELLAGADLDLRGQRAWPDELVMEVLVARLRRRLAP